jgi:hypothetical protein
MTRVCRDPHADVKSVEEQHRMLSNFIYQNAFVPRAWIVISVPLLPSVQ